MKLSRRFYPSADLLSDFDHFFNRAFSRSLVPGARQSNGNFGVYEADEAWHLRTDLPGFTKDDVNLRFEDGVLYLGAERDENAEHAFHSRIERTFRVPDNVDTTAIEANLQNGVLEVVLPKLKSEEPETLRIEVK